MKYTKKERNAIYRKALELFYKDRENKFYAYLCLSLTDATGSRKPYTDNRGFIDCELVIKAFPEFGLMQDAERIQGSCGAWWPRLEDSVFDYNSRENALLFCIEMTK